MIIDSIAEKERLRKKALYDQLNKSTVKSNRLEKTFYYRIWQWIRHPVLSFKRFIVLTSAKNPNSIYNQEGITGTLPSTYIAPKEQNEI